ncbi:GGDEF domain-containing protein [Thermoleophilia bacterium SCSIO 60948]|nr:GGDEF domain-containing protein [Thermoleophilia bacterium SCSIO 60948]
MAEMPLDDEDHLRVQMVRAGVFLSFLLVAVVGAWIAVTWDEPNRVGLLVFDALALAATCVVASFSPERIVASPHRERLFLGWSVLLIIFIGAAAALDGGVRSPILLLLFLTMVFAALSYPRNTVAVVSVLSLATVIAAAQAPSAQGSITLGPTYVAALTLTIALVGVMCVWQARILQDQRNRLVALSRLDPLTGCVNRRGFALLVEAGLERVRERDETLSIVLLDFDAFKTVNDTLGHAAGDDLLRWAAAELRAGVREGDAVARLGGDEFALLLPGRDGAAADAAAARIRETLAPRIGISTGTACADSETTPDEFLRAADVVLYAAKERLRPRAAPAPAGA